MNLKFALLVVAALAPTFLGQAQVLQQAQTIPAVTPTAAQIPFGSVLDVIPYVSADGYTIQMSIVPTLTEFLGYDTENARQFQTVVGNAPVQPTPLPKFRVRQVTTSAIVWDGQTIVLGGLIAETVSKSRSKVPIMGDIPLLGRFFRSEFKNSVKKNLVIFVSPTIIDPAGNRIHPPEYPSDPTYRLPYDPNTLPPQVPVAK